MYNKRNKSETLTSCTFEKGQRELEANYSDKMVAGSFYEFFAGGGMARAGLGENWRCLLANDFDHKKCHSYTSKLGRF